MLRHPVDGALVAEAFRKLTAECHLTAIDRGWWFNKTADTAFCEKVHLNSRRSQ